MTAIRNVMAPTLASMSPPLPSRGIAFLSLAVSLVIFYLLASYGYASTREYAEGAAHWVQSAAGVLASLVGATLVFFSIRALIASFESARGFANGDVVGARAKADSARQQSFVALGLAAATVVGFCLFVLVTVNDGAVQKTFLRWDLIHESGYDVCRAFLTNVWLSIASEILVLIFGLVLAIARMLPGRAGAPLRALAVAYIDTMRAIPAIIVLYLVGFGLPIAKIPLLSGLAPEWYAVIALTLTFSAYTAEIFRSGIESIHASQWSSARSLGFSYFATLQHIILPQAVRLVVPPLLSAFIALQKDTSLVNIIGSMDAFNQAKFYASASFNLSAVTSVALLFIIFTIPQTRFVDWMLHRGQQKRKGGK